MDDYIRARVIWPDPLVVYSACSPAAPVTAASLLRERLRHRRVHFLILLCWTAEQIPYFEGIEKFVHEGKEISELHQYTIMCNTVEETARFRNAGIPSIFMNHNVFVDEALYRPLTIEKKFDAVYNATLQPWKRHDLCAKIGQVAFIYHSGPNTLEAYKMIGESIPGARFMNAERSTEPHGHLMPEQVNQILNEAHCGLCLSAAEGAMHSSIEYLLAGIPVVTTPALGGRDFFFEPEFSSTVEPDRTAVAEAVEHFKLAGLDPLQIRTATLRRVYSERERFFNFINGLLRAEGERRDIRDEWESIFCNKLLGWEPLDVFLSHLH